MEAAACGAPVVATVESPLPELLAGGGLFVEPGQLEPLANAMQRLLANSVEQRAMSRVALERARALTWPRGAAAALEALEKCAR